MYCLITRRSTRTAQTSPPASPARLIISQGAGGLGAGMSLSASLTNFQLHPPFKRVSY
ncbi:MAG: hypothetical protein KJ666_18025 [Bacteroidetes bacterium]|nr:hypothetical protein [Bacteroidota bacterium]